MVSGSDLEEVAVGVRSLGYEPARIGCAHGAIDSFNLKSGRVMVRVTNTVEKGARTDDQLVPAASCVDEVNRLNKGLTCTLSALATKKSLSKYSPGALNDLSNYGKGPRSGLVGNVDPVDTEEYLCIDQGRAYTAHLANLKVIPVFSSFDEFHPVKPNHKIQPLSRYKVRCYRRDVVLL